MGGTREPWYKNAIIYGVDVATFQDANGDGIGDFMGVCDRLDYLTELGVTCLWLLPFFPTPNRDNGYDVKNYYEVDPRLGTFEDFLRLVHRAGERGIRIMIDLVMDHTSNEHPNDMLAYTRQAGTRRFLVALNLSEKPVEVPFSELSPARILLSTHLDREGDACERSIDLRAEEGAICALDE